MAHNTSTADGEKMDTVDIDSNSSDSAEENLSGIHSNPKGTSSPVTGKRKHGISPLASSTQTNTSLEIFDETVTDPNAISPEHKKRIVPGESSAGKENSPVGTRGRGTRRATARGGAGRGVNTIYKAPTVNKKTPAMQLNKRIQPKRITKKAAKKLNGNKPSETPPNAETQAEIIAVMLGLQKQMSQMQDDNAKNLEKTATKEDIEQIVEKAHEGLNQQIQRFAKDIESCNRRIQKLEDNSEVHTRNMYEITKDVQELKIDMALRRDAEKKTRGRCETLEELNCKENIEEIKRSLEHQQNVDSKYDKLQHKIDDMDTRMSKLTTTMKEMIDNQKQAPMKYRPEQNDQMPKRGKGVPDHVRKRNIVIDGLEERQYEDLFDTTKEIAKELGIPLARKDFNNAFRLGSYTKNRRRPRPVMLSLVSEQKRNEIMDAKAQLPTTRHYRNIQMNADEDKDVRIAKAKQRKMMNENKIDPNKTYSMAVKETSKKATTQERGRSRTKQIPQDKQRRYGSRSYSPSPTRTSTHKARQQAEKDKYSAVFGNSPFTIRTKMGFAFFTKNSTLSCFHPTPVTYRNVEYPTREHAYQSAKAIDAKNWEALIEINKAKTPGRAKQIGNDINPSKRWGRIKADVMESIEMEFYKQHKDMREQLLATDELELVEGSEDSFWGGGANLDSDTIKESKSTGQNMLGKKIMKVRADMKKMCALGAP